MQLHKTLILFCFLRILLHTLAIDLVIPFPTHFRWIPLDLLQSYLFTLIILVKITFSYTPSSKKMLNLFEVFFSCFEGQKYNFSIFFYIIASALKSCLIKNLKKNWEKIFGGQKQATTYNFLVGNRECNTERGYKNQLYIELGL